MEELFLECTPGERLTLADLEFISPDHQQRIFLKPLDLEKAHSEQVNNGVYIVGRGELTCPQSRKPTKLQRSYCDRCTAQAKR
jgi:hypothetical protein